MNNYLKFLSFLLFTGIAGCSWYVTMPLQAYQMVDAIDIGAPALPYYAYSDTTLEVLNDELKKAKVEVTIEDVYKYAYKKPFKDVPPDGDTGQTFEDMATATGYLQNILKAKGVSDPDSYFMTSIDSAKEFGFTLMAAVQRTDNEITVVDKFGASTESTWSCGDLAYYQPYRFDCKGKALDTVYEWAALPNDCFNKQGHQAILLALTANKLLQKNPKADYWEAEKRWISGDYVAVIVEQDYTVCQALGIEEGYTQQKNLFSE